MTSPEPSLDWRPDRLLQLLLLWTTLLTSVLVWLPLVRGLVEGQAYRWSLTEGIGGRGTGGDYWLLVLGGLFVFALLYFGWRGARQPFHWLLLIFHGGFAIAVLRAAVVAPDQLFFEGATVGVKFSFAKTAPALVAAILICAVVWVIRDLRHVSHRSAPPWTWTHANRVRLALVIGMVPIQIILLRRWGPLSAGAMVGVSLTVWQWFLITQRLLAPVRGGQAASAAGRR